MTTPTPPETASARTRLFGARRGDAPLVDQSLGGQSLIGPSLAGPSLAGMVHLLPLPGSPRWSPSSDSMDRVLDRARADARALLDGGMDALIVENFGDVPFESERVSPETLAAMTLAVAAVMEEAGGAAVAAGDANATPTPVGVNLLRNDAAGALAVAAVTGAAFIRVNVHTGTMFTDQGIIEGRAADTLRKRAALAPDVSICADVHVKHATPPPGASIEAAARDTRERGLADVLIVSGPGTGHPVDVDRLSRVRAAVPDAPLWVGSGVTPATVRELLAIADGVIVGSALQRGGRAGEGVEPERIRAFIDAARG